MSLDRCRACGYRLHRPFTSCSECGDPNRDTVGPGQVVRRFEPYEPARIPGERRRVVVIAAAVIVGLGLVFLGVIATHEAQRQAAIRNGEDPPPPLLHIIAREIRRETW